MATHIKEIKNGVERFLMNRRIFKYGIMLAAIFVVTLFIFSNSFAGYDASHSTSNSVSEIILPDKYTHSETTLTMVRKAAHLIEYAVLGCAVKIVVWSLRDDLRKNYFGTALFYVLAVAVIDEHIQSFSDRTSSTADIVLDFFGALIGFLIGWLIVKVYEKIKQYCKKKIRTEVE